MAEQQLQQRLDDLTASQQQLSTLNKELDKKFAEQQEIMDQNQRTMNASPYLLEGQIKIQSANYGDAIKPLTTAHNFDPLNPATSTLLGFALIMDKDVKGAIQILEQTVKSKNGSDYGWAHYNLALAYLKDGRQQDAIEQIGTLLDKQPGFWCEFEKDIKFKELKGLKDYTDFINQAKAKDVPCL